MRLHNRIEIIFFLVLGLLLCSLGGSNSLVAEEELLTPAQMKENMKFMRDSILENHPNPYNSISKYEYKMLFNELLSEMKEPLSPVKFSFIARRFVMPLRDAHTTTGYDFTKYEDLYLPFQLLWLADGLGIHMVSEEFEELRHGKILEIEGVAADVWLDRLAKIVPHETLDWVRLQGNWIKSRNLLSFFTGRPDLESVSLTVEKGGKVSQIVVPFLPKDQQPHDVPESDEPEEPEEPDYIVTEFMEELSAGYIAIYKCLDTPEFFAEINDFMEEVKSRKLKNIIIEMRYNSGGASSYTWEFMKHFLPDEFKSFTGVTTEGEKRKRERDALFKYDKSLKREEFRTVSCPSIRENENEGIEPFMGKVFILVSRITFSSGNYFPIAFKDNNLATIVGQRTGNSPCAYGDYKDLKLPHGELWLNVSTKYFIRPSCVCDTNALIPDVDIPLTLDDVFNKRDPVMDWVNKHLK